MLVHWINVHVWGPMWPNIFAPSVFTVLGIAIGHLKHSRELQRLHGKVDGLIDRDRDPDVTGRAGPG